MKLNTLPSSNTLSQASKVDNLVSTSNLNDIILKQTDSQKLRKSMGSSNFLNGNSGNYGSTKDIEATVNNNGEKNNSNYAGNDTQNTENANENDRRSSCSSKNSIILNENENENINDAESFKNGKNSKSLGGVIKSSLTSLSTITKPSKTPPIKYLTFSLVEQSIGSNLVTLIPSERIMKIANKSNQAQVNNTISNKNVNLIASKSEQTPEIKTPLKLTIQKLGTNASNQKTILESNTSKELTKTTMDISQNKTLETNGQKEFLDSSSSNPNNDTTDQKVLEESKNAKSVLDPTSSTQKEVNESDEKKLTKELNENKKVQIKTPSEIKIESKDPLNELRDMAQSKENNQNKRTNDDNDNNNNNDENLKGDSDQIQDKQKQSNGEKKTPENSESNLLTGPNSDNNQPEQYKRKNSLRLAEAAKQKEIDTATPESNKSNSLSDNETNGKLNEEKKQLRPRNKRISNDGGLHPTANPQGSKLSKLEEIAFKKGKRISLPSQQNLNTKASGKIAKLSTTETAHNLNSNKFISIYQRQISNETNTDEISMDISETPFEALSRTLKGNASTETIKNNQISSNTYNNVNNSRNHKDSGSTINKLSSNNSHSKINGSYESTAINQTSNFDAYKDPRNQNEIHRKKLSNSNLLTAGSSNNGSTKDFPHHAEKNTNYQTNHEDTEHAIFCTALKLAYLHSTDKISDGIYDFMFKSLSLNNSRLKAYFSYHHHSPYTHMSLNKNPNDLRETSKILLKKYLIEYIDNQTSAKIKSSPLYSLILQADVDFLAVYVYINYLDHTSFKKSKSAKTFNSNEKLEQRRLIKIINLRSFNQVIETDSANMDTKYRQIQSGLSNHTKWSKFLIEQLKNTIVNVLGLEKQDLMCISIDNRLLEKICFPTFQLYLSDFFHDNILIIPSFLATKPLASQLAEWKYGELNLKESFFKPLINFIKYLKHVNLNDLNFNQLSLDEVEEFFDEKKISEYFRGFDLVKLIEILEFIYINYSKIVSHLKKITESLQKNNSNQNVSINKNDSLDHNLMYETFDSLDYFYMTCLMCDLCKFLFDYQIHPKKFSSSTSIKLPWYFNGSYLNNLLCEQLTENIPITPCKINNNKSMITSPTTTPVVSLKCEKPNDKITDPLSILKNFNGFANKNKQQPQQQQKSDPILMQSPVKSSQKPLIECDKSRLDYLNSTKQSIEKVVLDLLDFCSENSVNKEKFSFLTTLIDDNDDNSDTIILMCEIYSILCQMFDVNLDNIKMIPFKNEFKFDVDKNLSNNQLNQILTYYKFQKLIDLSMAKFQYKKFIEAFFDMISSELENELNTDNQSSNLNRSLMDSNLGLKRKFIDFVYQSNTSEFCPTISFLALNYLILPSLVDFKDPYNSRAQLNLPPSSSPLTSQEVIYLEQKLKIVNAIENPNVVTFDEENMISLDEISDVFDQIEYLS